ncbi:MAG: hypothetical protein H0V52_01935 [Acidimicrobiia bacterium]|nr:hypothetical protein [Acidimicrobiia bacterium]
MGEPAEPLSKVSLSSMLDGVWRLDGHLNPLDGEILDTALAASPAVTARRVGPTLTM